MVEFRRELLDPEALEAARQSRDVRFDGRFFVGVLTTGIYCRPVCPVRVPMKENVQLYRTAAAAAGAGFRPCLRCRPESSPGTPAWTGASWKVSRALQLIDQGFLDDAGVAELAAQLEVGPRQLSRLFQQHLGASPVEVGKTRRLHFAKKLIDETDLPLAEVCFAAGFGSVRRFNAVFNEVYGRSPRALRRHHTGKPTDRTKPIRLTLSYRPPYDWRALLDFLAYRAIPGVEQVTGNSYARTFRLGQTCGDFEVRFGAGTNAVELRINSAAPGVLFRVVDRVRALLDLRADSGVIEADLARDKLLGDLVRRYPGTRVPGCWDGLEVAVRAVLGQQVTVRAATTLVSRVVARHGTLYRCANPALTHLFPEAQTLATADFDGLGIVGQRIGAIRQLAALVREGDLAIDPTAETAEFVARICNVKGIGEWTAQYIAMRALNDPDAFPYGDLILRRAAGDGDTLAPRELLQRAADWQPWRAYAVLLLWRHYGDAMKPARGSAGKRVRTQQTAARKSDDRKQSQAYR